MKRIFHVAVIIVLLISVNAYAAYSSVADVQACKERVGLNQPFILVLKKGSELNESIIDCMHNAKISAATFTGFGALLDPTLAYFNLKTKEYQYKKFPGAFELLALNGDISQLDNKPFTHMHVVLGDENYHVIGGHLSKANVGATIEITITPLKGAVVRKAVDQGMMNLVPTNKK